MKGPKAGSPEVELYYIATLLCASHAVTRALGDMTTSVVQI
jgi:hypothetical protein